MIGFAEEAHDLRLLLWLWIVPAAFLCYARVFGDAVRERPDDGVFLHRYCVFFALASMAEVWTAGPLRETLGIGAVLAFALLADFRVFWLVAVVSRRVSPWGALPEAAAWTCVAAGAGCGLASASSSLSGLDLDWGVLSTAHALSLAACVGWIRSRVLPARLAGRHEDDLADRVRVDAILGYAFVTALLFTVAEIWTLSEAPASGLVAALPRFLHYSLYAPFAYFVFFPSPGVWTPVAIPDAPDSLDSTSELSPAQPRIGCRPMPKSVSASGAADRALR